MSNGTSPGQEGGGAPRKPSRRTAIETKLIADIIRNIDFANAFFACSEQKLMEEKPMADNRSSSEVPDLTRRRALFRLALATAGAATAIYVAPVVVRIDEAEAKGSKRPKGPSKRPKGPSRRQRGSRRGRR